MPRRSTSPHTGEGHGGGGPACSRAASARASWNACSASTEKSVGTRILESSMGVPFFAHDPRRHTWQGACCRYAHADSQDRSGSQGRRPELLVPYRELTHGESVGALALSPRGHHRLWRLMNAWHGCYP